MDKRERLKEIQERRSKRGYCYHAENLGEREEDFFVSYIEELLNPWKDASKELPEDTTDIVIRTKALWIEVSNYEDEKFIVDDGYYEVENVTHWMYIPEIQGE